MPASGPIAFDWVTIPAGEFRMGSDGAKDKEAYDEETPRHTVHLHEYRIARVPMTVAQFAEFVGARAITPRRRSRVGMGLDRVQVGEIKGVDWSHPRGPKSHVREKQDHPVTCVSWHDAVGVLPMGKRATADRGGVGEGGVRHGRRVYPWGDRGAEPTGWVTSA